ncbi:hypothetical protein RvY_02632 [Ramazzottius varieornatus]|uniref:Uncharacterized protein n=1 Tax=Ramazzottius varieornatus TaxID=947166 RepID=A0A1D1USG4_RAMVA|nr:hypothetical protein RvY_02632 [Ramazzottius varieornatus]
MQATLSFVMTTRNFQMSLVALSIALLGLVALREVTGDFVPSLDGSSPGGPAKAVAQEILQIIQLNNTSDKDGVAKPARSVRSLSSTSEFEEASDPNRSSKSKDSSSGHEKNYTDETKKIKATLLRMLGDAKFVDLKHARLFGEVIGEIAVNAKHQDSISSSTVQTSSNNSTRSTLSQKAAERIIVPVGTALAEVLVEKRPPKDADTTPDVNDEALQSKGPLGAALGTVEKAAPAPEESRKAFPTAPEIHTTIEHGINFVIDSQNTDNQSLHDAHSLANQIHLQELAVCGHLILNKALHPSDYLSAVGAGVSTVIDMASVHGKKGNVTKEQVTPLLQQWIASYVKIELILNEQNITREVEDNVAFLADEVANYTAGDIYRLMDKSVFPEKALQELSMASGHYAKALWNIRVLNLGSLIVLRVPPSQIVFTLEEELSSLIPPAWLEFGDGDVNEALAVYHRVNRASSRETPGNGTDVATQSDDIDD